MEVEEGIPLEKKSPGGWIVLLKQRLPIVEWAPKYNQTAAIADLVAGITLGLTLVPQSIAYASLANLPVQYGLYSAFMGTMLYTFLGTVKEVSIGPTSLMALITLQTCRGLPIEFVVLLAFLAGCVVFVMGLLRLGFLVDLISPSVTSGFTSATAITIVASQLKGLLGISFVAESIPENLYLIFSKWSEVRLTDCALGAVCCTVLLLLRKLKDLPVSPKRYRLKKVLWLLSIARNALIVGICSTIAFTMHSDQNPLFKLSGRVEPGIPRFSLPPFSATIGNETVGFFEMVHTLGSAVVMTPVVMVLANIAIAKAFSPGGRVDATQEMMTLGLCNVAGSFVHAMPTCGAFTRSAVSHSSGIRTPAAGMYSGVITLLALNFLTQYFFFIPRACLSSVLICAVIFMVDFRIVVTLWRKSKRELVLLLLTFAIGVWKSLELSVIFGVGTGLVLLIRDVMRSPILMTQHKCRSGDVIRISVRRALVYANCEKFAALVLSVPCPAAPAPRGLAFPVVVDCSVITLMDYTATEVISRLINKFKERDQKLVFYNASSEAIGWLEGIDNLDKRALKCRCVQEALDAAVATDNEAHDETSLLLQKVPATVDENV
ncbi:sodium-independent sulfate anion transporter-like [Leptidea sinapis]|uniref:sodium-independent sulfate anion transporter-like n=1 Tax=Leptidea sinapis TaxID=189913 RepID=UPI0021237B1C|nr:sodium-independent sulfate anion transporter-like [Leptidea sinapis]